MLRSMYKCLIRAHPPRFRERFSQEMLSIFDHVDGLNARCCLLADALISFVRQWGFRSEYESQQFENAAAVDAVSIVKILPSCRLRATILINGAILTCFLFSILCYAFRYDWTHPLFVRFPDSDSANATADTSRIADILPVEELNSSKRQEKAEEEHSRRQFRTRSIDSTLSWQKVINQQYSATAEVAIPSYATGNSQATAATAVSEETADLSPHKTRFVVVDRGVKVEVLDWGGSGRDLVLLAGMGSTAHVFDNVAPKLVSHYHVCGITRRGFGNSSAPRATTENYSADRLGDDVLAVIKSLGLKRPVLVGHSIAGEELSDIGARHPEMVTGLVYLDAAYSYAFYDPSRGDLILDSIELRNKLDQLIPGRETTDRKHVYEDLLVMLPQFENELHAHQQEMRNIPEPLDSATPKVMQAIVAGEQRFAEMTVPTLAIFAFPHDLDSVFKKNSVARAAAEKADRTGAQIRFLETKYPSIRLVCIPHARHFVFQSNEADVLHELNSFINGLNVKQASANNHGSAAECGVSR